LPLQSTCLHPRVTTHPHRPSDFRSVPQPTAYLHPPTAMASGPPRCPCGEHLLAQLSPDLQARWAAREGISWSWYRGLAYFHFRHTCHNAQWRADVRGKKGNRHTRPVDAAPMAGVPCSRSSRRRLVNGELFYRACAGFLQRSGTAASQALPDRRCLGRACRAASVVRCRCPLPATTASRSWTDLVKRHGNKQRSAKSATRRAAAKPEANAAQG